LFFPERGSTERGGRRRRPGLRRSRPTTG
jgi:hypothetical protein